MHNNIVRGAAVSSLLAISSKLVDAGHERDGSHVLLAALRITLETRLASGKNKNEKLAKKSRKPIESTVTRCRQLGIIDPTWFRLLTRFVANPAMEGLFLEKDFVQVLKFIEFMQREVDQMATKAARKGGRRVDVAAESAQGTEVEA